MGEQKILDDIIDLLGRARRDGRSGVHLSPEDRETLLRQPVPVAAADAGPAELRDGPAHGPAHGAVTVNAAGIGAVAVNECDLAALAAVVAACRRCPLHRERRQSVFADGSPTAALLFVGEGPGEEEDNQGKPFVGRAGQLLTKMIEAMHLRREDVYICNIVKCRPPQNRQPTEEEARSCLPFLERQIALVQPRVIVLLGATPLLYLLGKKGITSRRGTWDEYRGIPVMPTYHPAYLLRVPSRKREAWEDLQQVMARLGR